MLTQFSRRILARAFRIGFWIGASPFEWDQRSGSLRWARTRRALAFFYVGTALSIVKIAVLWARFAISFWTCSAAEIIFQTACVVQNSMALQFRVNTILYGREYAQFVNGLLKVDERFSREYPQNAGARAQPKPNLGDISLKGQIGAILISSVLFGLMYFVMGPSFPLYGNEALHTYSVDSRLWVKTLWLLPELWMYAQACYGVFVCFGVVVVAFHEVRYWLARLDMDNQDRKSVV